MAAIGAGAFTLLVWGAVALVAAVFLAIAALVAAGRRASGPGGGSDSRA